MNFFQAAIAWILTHRRTKNLVVSGCWCLTMEGCLFPGKEWAPIKDVFYSFDKETQHCLTFTPVDGEWANRAKFWKRELRSRLAPEMYHDAMLKICGWYAECVRKRLNVRLPVKIVAMLRGEIPYDEESKPLAQLAISYYRDGKRGEPYEPVKEDPSYPAWTAQCLNHLLKAAHKQGQVDAKKLPAAGGGTV